MYPSDLGDTAGSEVELVTGTENLAKNPSLAEVLDFLAAAMPSCLALSTAKVETARVHQ